jgi:hypothetical protein
MENWFHPLRFEFFHKCQQHTRFMTDLFRFNDTRNPEFKHDSVFVFREILNSHCVSNHDPIKKMLTPYIIKIIFHEKETAKDIDLIFDIYCENYIQIKNLY